MLTRWFREFSLRVADQVVVRGPASTVAQRIVGGSEVIQDGRDTRDSSAAGLISCARQHGLDGVLTWGWSAHPLERKARVATAGFG